MPLPELQIAPENRHALRQGPDIVQSSPDMSVYIKRIRQHIVHHTGAEGGGFDEAETAALAAEYHAGKEATAQIPSVKDKLGDIAQMRPSAQAELLNKWRLLTQASRAGSLATQKIIETNLPLAYFFAQESLGIAHEMGRISQGKGGSRPRVSGYFGPLRGLALPGGHIEDRMSNAAYGLLKALPLWDPAKNDSFGGFAGNHVHNELMRGVANPAITEYNGPRIPEGVIGEYLSARRAFKVTDLNEVAGTFDVAERERLRELQRYHEMRYAYFLEDLQFSSALIKEETDAWSFPSDPTLPAPNSAPLPAPALPSGEERALTEEEYIEAAWSTQMADTPPQLADLQADPNMSVEEEVQHGILRERIDRLLPIVIWRGYAAAAQKEQDAPERLARDVAAMRLRFGLDDGQPKNRGEVAKLLAITKGSVRNIEIGMINRLRRPPYVDQLRGFL